MANPRNKLKGKSISFKTADGDEFKCDFTQVLLDNEESDDKAATFCDVESGGAVDWLLKFESIQSTDLESFWTFAWDNAGKVVSCVFSPHGNEVATSDKPLFRFDVRMGTQPPIGGKADETWLFEREFKLEGAPVMDRGTTTADPGSP